MEPLSSLASDLSLSQTRDSSYWTEAKFTRFTGVPQIPKKPKNCCKFPCHSKTASILNIFQEGFCFQVPKIKPTSPEWVTVLIFMTWQTLCRKRLQLPVCFGCFVEADVIKNEITNFWECFPFVYCLILFYERSFHSPLLLFCLSRCSTATPAIHVIIYTVKSTGAILPQKISSH